ncbi:hypothetical protein [Methylorubrum salsuginis]|uniref:Uncharacterized protein n=1 Tax=Methylorubrum salsuginis TaxID=414703 RepID=A0A1I4MIE3_9HYPH|nr:hypothetical protein [Methylorubrum salsuginis]SFM02999.1 hypothetical protein SAMN04488125_13916 [Methylorubrum salsuginis]
MRLIERSPEWWADRIAGEPDVPITAGRPVIETEPTAGPSPAYVEILRQYLQAAIDAGLCTLPKGMTVDEVVASFEWAPIGTVSLFGEGNERAEISERGWIQDLRG